jgi:hypothetical protein
MSKSKYLVDDEMDALDYADEYVYEEYKKDEKQKAKEEGREEKVKAPKPKVAVPKAAPKPLASVPKKLTAVVKAALEPVENDFFPVLEAVDDWEAAMDNLDAFVSKQEEQRQASAKKS